MSKDRVFNNGVCVTILGNETRISESEFLVGHEYDHESIIVRTEDGVFSRVDGEDVFMNSTVQLLLKSLEYFDSTWDPDEDYVGRAKKISHFLSQNDAAAVASDDTWWSLVVEQVEDGLL